MTLLDVLSQVSGLVWHTPTHTKSYTLYPGVYKGVNFYVYQIDGTWYMGRTGGNTEVTVTNPVKNLETLALGTWG